MKTGHVGLNVTDLDRSVDFYRRVLDLELLSEIGEGKERYARLGRDGELLITLWQQSTGTFDTARPGLHHLAFQVDTPDEVRKAEQVVRELGATLFYDGVVAHREGATSGGIFFTDPDGTRLEIATADIGTAPAPHADAPTCGFF